MHHDVGFFGHPENWVLIAFCLFFIIFGAFFETIFSSFSNIVFPVLLILLGAYLVLSRSGLLGGTGQLGQIFRARIQCELLA